MVNQKLQIEDVQAALKQMNPDRAEALQLRIFAELSHAEIGIVIGKSEGAAKTLVWRAMTDLRHYFNTQEACANE